MSPRRSRLRLLRVRIDGFAGYRNYPLPFRVSSPGFTVQGPGGPFSNRYFPAQGTPPPAGGAIAFSADGRRMGLGFISAFNPSSSAALALGGGMTCVRRRR